VLDDPLFGRLESAAYSWTRPYDLMLAGRTFTVTLSIGCDPGEDIDERQRAAFAAFTGQAARCLAAAETAILEHYRSIRPDYAAQFGPEASAARLPVLDSTDDLAEVVTPTALLIPEGEFSEARIVALLLDCSWDPSLGLAVVFADESVSEVGPQDIIL